MSIFPTQGRGYVKHASSTLSRGLMQLFVIMHMSLALTNFTRVSLLSTAWEIFSLIIPPLLTVGPGAMPCGWNTVLKRKNWSIMKSSRIHSPLIRGGWSWCRRKKGKIFWRCCQVMVARLPTQKSTLKNGRPSAPPKRHSFCWRCSCPFSFVALDSSTNFSP